MRIEVVFPCTPIKWGEEGFAVRHPDSTQRLVERGAWSLNEVVQLRFKLTAPWRVACPFIPIFQKFETEHLPCVSAEP